MVWCGAPLVAIARLSWKARRQGGLSEKDCRRALLRSCSRAADVASKAQLDWDKHKRLWKVIWLAVKWPFVTGALALIFRGCCNSLVVPLLIKQIVDAIVEGERDLALHFVLILVSERILGSLLELWGTRTMAGTVPDTFVCTIGSLVARKVGTPGVHGVHDAGVDPVAFLGRELTMVYTRVGSMGHRGFLAVPTLFAGSVTLLLLLGWPATLGIVWVLLTIRTGYYLQTRGKAAEEKMSTFATQRLGVLSNVLSAIKAIKYFAWEPEFLEVLHTTRQNECGALRQKAFMSSFSTTLGKLTPVTGALITFVTFVLVGNQIKAGDIFACNSVFMTMRFSVGASAMLFEISKSVQLVVQRASRVLMLPESPARVVRDEQHGVLAAVADLKVSFKVNGFQLSVIGEMIVGHRGKITAICGAVGSGKSTLMNALVSANGEGIVEGLAWTVGNIGWATQKPFIISGTILENILLGRKCDCDLLEHCLADACLGSDLDSFQDGLNEVIGDRGTTLSGGQQTRLSLARALYGEPEMLLLDDPLAAVDASVGRAILHALRIRCGHGMDAAEKNDRPMPGVIMVLNQMQLLPMFDKIIHVKDGQCSLQVGGLPANEGLFKGIDSLWLAIDDEVDMAAAREELTFTQVAIEAMTQTKARGQLVRKEVAATGLVKWKVVREYLFAPGTCFLFSLIALYITTYSLLGARDWWLGIWADEGGGQDFHLVFGFVAFSFAHIVASVICVLAIGTFAKRAGERLHADSINRLLRSTMGFFDETPAGRITSRFGPDLGSMDSMMFTQLDFTMTFGFTTLVMCTSVVIKVPAMAVVFLLAICLSVPVVHGFIIFQQDVKRHSNNAVAPILSNLGEMQRGAELINVFGCVPFFVQRHYESTDAWTVLFDSALLLTAVAEMWVQFMHLFVIGTTGMLTFADMDSLRATPGLVGMYFSYAALWGLFASASVSITMQLLSNMTSLERILEYKFEGVLPVESAWHKDSDPAPESWPSLGRIDFQNVTLRYRENLPLALAGLSLSISGGEKLGIVGRTGAGKSSITTILFRLVECESGRVLIDGVDIARLGIHTLRRAISMIPQEPIVMNGSVAYNLDPFGKHDKAKLERVLAETGLSVSMTLDTPAAGGDAALSSGQKQLVTFGRTLLQTSQLVVMDEPTASVDMQTDRLLQIVARRVFADRTVLTIAHRLETVRDCDRIAVMDAGILAELGTPEELLNDPSSRLAQMHRNATNSSGEEARETANSIDPNVQVREVNCFSIGTLRSMVKPMHGRIFRKEEVPLIK